MTNKISLPPKFLIERYKNWKSNEYSKNEVQLRKLASSGQRIVEVLKTDITYTLIRQILNMSL